MFKKIVSIVSEIVWALGGNMVSGVILAWFHIKWGDSLKIDDLTRLISEKESKVLKNYLTKNRYDIAPKDSDGSPLQEIYFMLIRLYTYVFNYYRYFY